jgi:hypothetical protein
MSKSNGRWNGLSMGIVCALLGLVALAFTQSLFMLFFVPIIVAVVWRNTSAVKRLEERLARAEPDQSNPSGSPSQTS